MPNSGSNPDDCRQQAESLRKLAKATSDHDAALAYNMRAIEFDYLAERKAAGQVRQPEAQLPPTRDQPVQQRPRVQPKAHDQKV